MNQGPDPGAALANYPLKVRVVERITAGHINLTFKVDAEEGVFTLQRIHPIFGPEVNLDIEAVTAHLVGRGVETPRLLLTRGGELWTVDPEGVSWRVLTFVPGEVVLAAESPARCAAAGACLGRVHRALWNLEYEFVHRRPGVHDTPHHLARLRAALDAHRDHRMIDAIAAVAQDVLAVAEGISLPPGLPLRVVHGDPKISNFVFSPDGEARAMIDLDTFSRMPLPLELGDALRSWCSPLGEESREAIDVEHFRAGVMGYAAVIGGLPTPGEREAIPLATALIAVELASRFCTDALEERYFAWDSGRFASSADHNLVRARAQLALGKSVLARLPDLAGAVNQAWG